VSSYSAGTLVMNMTSTGGSCGNSANQFSPSNCKRWLVSTPPVTTIINNSGSTLFAISESPTAHTNISGIKIAAGTGSGTEVNFGYTPSGRAILMHDMWLEEGSAGNNSLHSSTMHGVVWNTSFDATPFSMAPLAFQNQPGLSGSPQIGIASWTTPSTMGRADTTGENNFYVENSDFHAYLNAFDNDEAGRLVVRYTTMNNAGLGTHGADTGPYGQRHFEFYNNVNVFNPFSDGTTFPMNQWFFIRGGTFVIYNNAIPLVNSGDYPNKPTLNMTVMNLQRNGGPNPCWGQGTTGGGRYPSPRQIGMGRVSGIGVDGLGQSTDSVTYVGDSEPGYVWGNNGGVQLGNIQLTNYGTSFSDSCAGTTDSTANYVGAGRDYFNTANTAKPGWSPYTYPHPLRTGSSGTALSAPTNLRVAVN